MSCCIEINLTFLRMGCIYIVGVWFGERVLGEYIERGKNNELREYASKFPLWNL